MKENPNWPKLRHLNRSEGAKKATFLHIQSRIHKQKKHSSKFNWQPILTFAVLSILSFLVVTELVQNGQGPYKATFIEANSHIDHIAMERGTNERHYLLDRYTDGTLQIHNEKQVDEFMELVVGEKIITDHVLNSELQVLIAYEDGDKDLVLFEFHEGVTYASIAGESKTYQLPANIGDRLLSWNTFWPNVTIREGELRRPTSDDESRWVESEEIEPIAITDRERLLRLQEQFENELPERVEERMSRNRFSLGLRFEDREGYVSYEVDIRESDVLISTNPNRHDIFRYGSEMKDLMQELYEKSTQ
ncbi:hypothetical protein LGQ02_16125 [Bacillus shivajii]|uniref:hypothetical protein n=1 Tax=Bacillus shivajii TaxID=1983719 RepID=UPI001CF9D38B|nr:hypothetical protein [Bacillus shivajii]UCZ52356.1 hypothetical protein LGQ02_16125 [Bacillus shivajii]